MPHVDVTVSEGQAFSFCYHIATPRSPSAERIEPNLPCIFFLHSGYGGQEVFEAQFADRDIRQSNLIAMDMRGYGDTKGVLGNTPYTPMDSAYDVSQVMDKLNLPPCHIFAISNGCSVALELAIAHPYQVLSLTLCSPVSSKEPDEIAAGRIQVYNTWDDMSRTSKSGSLENEELADEVMLGASQLLFNHAKDARTTAISSLGMMNAKRRWSGSPEKLRESYKTCIEWFLTRRKLTCDMLKPIPMETPINIIHCFEDVGYPLACAQDLAYSLEDAGLRVTLQQVPGAHYGNVTDPDQINKILHNIISNVSCSDYTPRDPNALEEEIQLLKTPWSAKLAQYGYDPFDTDFDPLIPISCV